MRAIKNDSDYNSALETIDRLMGVAAGPAESDELEVLVTLVERYEATRWPVDEPDTFGELRAHIAGRERVTPSVSAAEAVRRERDSR